MWLAGFSPAPVVANIDAAARGVVDNALAARGATFDSSDVYERVASGLRLVNEISLVAVGGWVCRGKRILMP